MKNLVCSISVGKLDKNLVVDLDKEEEDFEEGEGATDFPVAKIANSDKYTLLQLDGKIQPDVVKKVLDLADKACEQIYDVQQKALKEVIEQ